MCFSLRCGIREKPRKSSLLRSCEPLHGGFVCQRTSCYLLRRRSKITSAIHRKLAKNACFSGVLASVVPASLLKLFLSAALAPMRRSRSGTPGTSEETLSTPTVTELLELALQAEPRAIRGGPRTPPTGDLHRRRSSDAREARLELGRLLIESGQAADRAETDYGTARKVQRPAQPSRNCSMKGRRTSRRSP